MEFGFDHIHFVCADVKAFAEYFQDIFDAEIVRYDEDFKGSPNAAVKIGRLMIFARGIRPEETPDSVEPELVQGLDHFGFGVPDVEAAVEWLRDKGAEIMMEPVRRGIGGRMIAYVRGPGNVRIELCENPAAL
ncbi:MAG: VOC family protein [Nitrospinae bacterium]|nr:VOC family protein [Nitrospinota bacterium]